MLETLQMPWCRYPKHGQLIGHAYKRLGSPRLFDKHDTRRECEKYLNKCHFDKTLNAVEGVEGIINQG